MKMYAFKCPQCGGNLEVEEDRDFVFCRFCGTKIQTNTLDKSELRIKEMEHEERMKDKELEAEKRDSKLTMFMAGGAVLLVVFMLILAFFFK